MTDTTNTPEPAPDNSAEQIRAALHEGRKIEAIRIYRAKSGVGLSEAKEAVERLDDDLRSTEPEKFSATQSGGCWSVIAFFAATIAVLGILLA